MHDPRSARSARSAVRARCAPVAALGLGAALALSGAACGPGDGGPRAGDGDASAWRLEPELTLGTREGGEAFDRVADVDRGPDGRIYVLDRGAGEVTVWGTDGRLLRRFGRIGEGPGELRTPTTVRVLDDGRIAVGEAFPARLLRFGPDGSLRGSLRVRPGRGGPPILAVVGDWRVTRAGVARVRLSYMSPSHADGTPVVVGSLDGDGRMADTLLSWISATTPARLPTIFQAEWSWDLAGDGALVASPGDRYELRHHDPAGRLLRVVRRDVPEIPVTEELTERAVDAFLERFADTDVSGPMLASLRDRLDVAPVLPRVQGLHLAEPGGELWVEVPTPDRTGEVREPGAYDVFDASGRYAARVRAPDGFRLKGIRDGRIHGVWEDELGVEHVRTYRVLRPR